MARPFRIAVCMGMHEFMNDQQWVGGESAGQYVSCDSSVRMSTISGTECTTGSTCSDRTFDDSWVDEPSFC